LRIEAIQQTIDGGVLEKVIAHRQQKWCANMTGGSKERDPILFPPIAIFDVRRMNARTEQLLKLRDHPLTLIADDKVESVDSGVRQQVKSV
jgi:hypothetical protein